MRIFADCRLTANALPTESCVMQRGLRVCAKNQVGGFRLNLPTRQLKITQRFQRIPSVGSRQSSPYSYGVTLAPPPDMAAASATPNPSTEREQLHVR
jgi:hypothetical protein